MLEITNHRKCFYNKEEVCFFKDIKKKFGQFSNMHGGFPLKIEDFTIKSTEALYQSFRYTDCQNIQQKIIDIKSPYKAKRISRYNKRFTRYDWIDVREEIMYIAVLIKTLQYHTVFEELFYDTHNKEIVELSHIDDFWGAKPINNQLIGANLLGKIWMYIRDCFMKNNYCIPKNVNEFNLINCNIYYWLNKKYLIKNKNGIFYLSRK